MKQVGITGGIGSGKTTICRIFEQLGIPVFNADVEAKKLYDDAKMRAKVVKLFGKKVLAGNGTIDKKKLAEVVFNNKASLVKLNALIHPAVKQQFEAWVKKQKGAKYVLKEAAILIESGANKGLDYIISIESPNELRISRIINRDKVDDSDINKRINEQLSDKERSKYADAVIVNDEQHSLIEQVLKIHKKLSGKV